MAVASAFTPNLPFCPSTQARNPSLPKSQFKPLGPLANPTQTATAFDQWAHGNDSLLTNTCQYQGTVYYDIQREYAQDQVAALVSTTGNMAGLSQFATSAQALLAGTPDAEALAAMQSQISAMAQTQQSDRMQRLRSEITRLSANIALLESEQELIPAAIADQKRQLTELEQSLQNSRAPSDQLIINCGISIFMFGVVVPAAMDVAKGTLLLDNWLGKYGTGLAKLYGLFRKDQITRDVCQRGIAPQTLVPSKATIPFIRNWLIGTGCYFGASAWAPGTSSRTHELTKTHIADRTSLFAGANPNPAAPDFNMPIPSNDGTATLQHELTGIAPFLANNVTQGNKTPAEFEQFLAQRVADLTTRESELTNSVIPLRRAKAEIEAKIQNKSLETLKALNPDAIQDDDLRALVVSIQQNSQYSWFDRFLQTGQGQFAGEALSLGIGFGPGTLVGGALYKRFVTDGLLAKMGVRFDAMEATIKADVMAALETAGCEEDTGTSKQTRTPGQIKSASNSLTTPVSAPNAKGQTTDAFYALPVSAEVYANDEGNVVDFEAARARATQAQPVEARAVGAIQQSARVLGELQPRMVASGGMVDAPTQIEMAWLAENGTTKGIEGIGGIEGIEEIGPMERAARRTTTAIIGNEPNQPQPPIRQVLDFPTRASDPIPGPRSPTSSPLRNTLGGFAIGTGAFVLVNYGLETVDAPESVQASANVALAGGQLYAMCRGSWTALGTSLSAIPGAVAGGIIANDATQDLIDENVDSPDAKILLHYSAIGLGTSAGLATVALGTSAAATLGISVPLATTGIGAVLLTATYVGHRIYQNYRDAKINRETWERDFRMTVEECFYSDPERIAAIEQRFGEIASIFENMGHAIDKGELVQLQNIHNSQDEDTRFLVQMMGPYFNEYYFKDMSPSAGVDAKALQATLLDLRYPGLSDMADQFEQIMGGTNYLDMLEFNNNSLTALRDLVSSANQQEKLLLESCGEWLVETYIRPLLDHAGLSEDHGVTRYIENGPSFTPVHSALDRIGGQYGMKLSELAYQIPKPFADQGLPPPIFDSLSQTSTCQSRRMTGLQHLSDFNTPQAPPQPPTLILPHPGHLSALQAYADERYTTTVHNPHFNEGWVLDGELDESFWTSSIVDMAKLMIAIDTHYSRAAMDVNAICIKIRVLHDWIDDVKAHVAADSDLDTVDIKLSIMAFEEKLAEYERSGDPAMLGAIGDFSNCLFRDMRDICKILCPHDQTPQYRL